MYVYISPSHHLTISLSHHLSIAPSHHLTISPSHHLYLSPQDGTTIELRLIPPPPPVVRTAEEVEEDIRVEALTRVVQKLQITEWERLKERKNRYDIIILCYYVICRISFDHILLYTYISILLGFNLYILYLLYLCILGLKGVLTSSQGLTKVQSVSWSRSGVGPKYLHTPPLRCLLCLLWWVRWRGGC
jgi:hypothetical protein